MCNVFEYEVYCSHLLIHSVSCLCGALLITSSLLCLLHGICVVSIIAMVVFLVPDGVGRVSSLRAVLRPVFTKHKEIQQSLPS